jgi:hypothetical protein
MLNLKVGAPSRAPAAGGARRRVGIPPNDCRGPAVLATRQVVTEERSHPAVELVPPTRCEARPSPPAVPSACP